MRNLILTALLLLLTATAFPQKKKTMNYDNQWKEVEAFEKKSLPKSAAGMVDVILKQAVADKNSPQVIKALIHQAKYELAVDDENNTLVFENLKEMLAKSKDGVGQAVLHSMLGELYYNYFNSDSWTINERTRLKGIVPDDMKEWSTNIFFDKAIEHFAASVEQQELLTKTDVQDYAAVIETGKDSRRLYPTFYDFLMRRAIDNLKQINSEKDLTVLLAQKSIEPKSLFASTEEYGALNFDIAEEEYGFWALEMYRRHLLSLNERGLNESVMHTELEKMDFLRRLSSAHNAYALPALERMLKEWRDKLYSVEIAAKMAELYVNEPPQQEDEKEQERKTETFYAFLNSEIERNPKYERIGLLENRLLDLTRPHLQVRGDAAFVPDAKKELKVQYKNVRGAKVSLYRVESPVELFQSGYLYGNDKKIKRSLVKSWRMEVPQLEPYKSGETTLTLDVSEMGSYMLEFEPESDYQSSETPAYHFVVSDLAVFSRLAEENRYEFYVVNRVSGKPVQDATINIYKLPGNWRSSKLTLDVALRTDASGLTVYEKKIPNNDVYYQAVKESDNGSVLNNLQRYYHYNIPSDKSREQLSIFTDRSLYRPGQVVYFKAIASLAEGDRESVVSNKKLEIRLRDANGREVNKQTLTTNEYGSVAGEFTLPQGALSGHYSILTDNGSVYFRVEEYKRPTFEVDFDKIEKTYQFGEEVTLKGRAENYSGIKLQGASVKYNIVRCQMWGRFWGGSSGTQFAEGMAVTNDGGEFEIKFTPMKSDTESYARQIYLFMVEAEVTDLNGETRIGNYTVTVGDVSMILSLDIADKMEKTDKKPVMITASNLDGKEIAAKGSYTVYTVQENDSIGKQVLSGMFETGEQLQLKQQLVKLASAKYRIILKSEDDRGNEVEAETDFVLFSYADKRPPIKTNEWLLRKRATFAKGQPAEIVLGVTDKDVHVLYELYQGNNLLDRKWMSLNNENRLFRVEHKNEYKEGVTLFLTYVKDELFYSHQIDISAERERKELDVRLDVFRDKVRPGSDEEWRISIKDAKGNAAPAEVLASMYDFSLDQIYKTSPWVLNSGLRNLYRSASQLRSDRSFMMEMSHHYFSYVSKRVPNFEFDYFNWFGFYPGFGVSNMLMSRSALSKNIVTGFGAPSPAPQADMVEEEALEVGRDEAQSDIAVEDDAAQAGDAAPQMRRNFNETAFFFPQLRTNADGETLIAFKVPDSNTKWRFRVLAHDKDLNVGQAEEFTVSQKELMVTPNMPRFLRHGDKTSISTKISNLSDGEISGTVRMEFFNILTDELITSIPMENNIQEFVLAKDASGSAVWTFDVPADINLLGVRILAESESFSDGEQHALAVLPNRMLVTESMRMDLNGNEDKHFVFDKLADQKSVTKTDYRLTLEFTSNPAWYAVQALPVLGTPDSENAVSWFAAYYANSLGAHIGKTYPKVSAMIEAWKQQGGTTETLISNLEKNEELKNVLLEETPWVLEAKNETEQKEKLSLLFDLNRNRNITQSAIEKLQELQTNRGGWSWFKGFYPSVSITQYMLYGFTQLQELNAIESDNDIKNMQQAAVEYIDDEALNRFEQLKKWNKNWKNIKSISVTDLEYLYIRSAYTEYKLSKESKELINFYTGVIKKHWTGHSLYSRSLIAMLMHKDGEQKVVQDMMNSYREHATIGEEMGMYWANNRSGVFMSQSGVSVHTFIMKAFQMTGASQTEMDNMKRWLLKQKQTQLWETTHATADAVYALLSTGSDWFALEGETVISLGGKTVEPENKDIGTGYIKESWRKTEIQSDMAEVEVSHLGSGPAWGALYYQYFEDLDKIEQSDGTLNVQKQNFVEINDGNGKKLIEITEENPLEVGDKVIVRLTVRTDRDMEFVHLKDMRASCFEPAEQISGTKWMNRVIYYQTNKDASTNFYFDNLPRGTYLFEYPVYVTRSGSYSNGITNIQSIYAPEFVSHTKGVRINVK